MKKFIIILVMLFSFVFIRSVNAARVTLVTDDNCVITENGKIQACSIIINVTDGPLNATMFPEITLTLTHADYQSFSSGNDWNVSIVSQTSSVIKFRASYNGTSIPNGQSTVFSITVQANGSVTDPCHIDASLGTPTYVCKKIYNGSEYVYYGSNGQVVTESVFNNECNPKCQYKDGVYYGPNGQILTSEIAMITACNSFVCQSYQGPSGTRYYFNKNGASVTQTAMIESCSCTKIGDKYYKHNMVLASNELDMIMECFPHVCQMIQGPSGTKYYFDKNGQRVNSESAMKSSCGCREENGRYYDANNNETDKLSYIISCQRPVCSSVDGYYFDKNGNSVTRAQMLKSCYACKAENGKYYNSNGEETTKLNYIISCHNPKCTEYEGYYFDKNGNQVADSAAVIQSCENPKCMKIDDNTYFDKNGNRVNSLEAYAKSCLVCQPYEDKYIKKDGKITTDVNEYITSCKSPKCESVVVNNKTYYYDKNGKQLKDEDEYNYYCTMHYCKIITINGEKTYYDIDGNKTTEENYNNTCKDKIICQEKITDGVSIYYDKTGNQVSRDTYLQQCFINSCKIVGDKYYDFDGKEISKVEYQQLCQVNKCEKIGDKYYDKNGKEVSKDEFDKECNPSTGSWIPTTILLLLGIGGASLFIAKRKKILFKI